MDAVGRLLLRFLLVPLGYLAAVLAGTLVILLGSWRYTLAPEIDTWAVEAFGMVIAGPLLLIMLMSTMWLPGAIGILLSEAFGLRSWIFHVANGVVSAWVGWQLFGYLDETQVPLNEPLPIIAAGIAAGFAYWAVAGFSAGFWKPVFRRPQRADIATAR